MIVPPCQHLILIPSYNTGPQVLATVREARRYWQPVWIVIDGSTDGSTEAVQALAAADPGLKVWVLSHNQGKGAAILHGLREFATTEPYHYARTQPVGDGEVVILGGEDHKTGQGGDTWAAYERLLAYARSRYGVKSVE